MLYLAIDQHKNQLTINIRNEQEDVVQKGQVSTNHADIDEFFVALVKKARRHRGYMAIVEVCGFNDWLLAKLSKSRCSEIVVIQPDYSAVNKTDKRDANALSEFLWNNRKRLQESCRRHYEARQCDRKTCVELCGDPYCPQRPVDEGVAQEDQKPTWCEDGKSRGDAKTYNDYLAYPPLGEAVSISLRPADTCAETGRPSVAEGGFRRHRQQESFSKRFKEKRNAFEMPLQNKGVIPVDPSYSLTSCSSALLVAASLDINSITHKMTKGKK